MRIRGTKPEFWKSKRICSVSWDARLVLKGLESYVDDNGVGVDDIELIVTDVFPRDMFANPRETVARVSEAIAELFRAGLVHRYEAGGDSLLYISFWESVQRIDKPGKGRNPRPDGTLDYKDSEIRESVASPPETLAPVTGEQGNRGTGEQVKDLSAEPDEFDQWYAKYPRKEAKDAAKKAFIKARKSAALQELLLGLEQYINSVKGKDRQFIALPATWLNAGRWQDEIPQESVIDGPWSKTFHERSARV
jgi:hypothetical protein